MTQTQLDVAKLELDIPSSLFAYEVVPSTDRIATVHWIVIAQYVRSIQVQVCRLRGWRMQA